MFVHVAKDTGHRFLAQKAMSAWQETDYFEVIYGCAIQLNALYHVRVCLYKQKLNNVINK